MKYFNVAFIWLFVLLGCLSTVTAEQKVKSKTRDSIADKRAALILQIFSDATTAYEAKDIQGVFTAQESLQDMSKSRSFTKQDEGTLSEVTEMTKKMCASISHKIESRPPSTEKEKAFSRPFSVRYFWADTNQPIKNIPITITYPTGLKNNAVVFDKKVELTNDAGIVSYTAVPNFTGKSEVTFQYIPQTKLFLGEKISIPYQVITSYRNAGGTLAIVDMNKDNQPIRNNSISSSRILAALINSGFRKIGNIDFIDQVVSGDDDAIQKATVAWFGTTNTYIIYGIVQYENITQNEKEFSVSLKADIKVRNLLKNEEIYKTTVVENATGKTEAGAIDAARLKIAETVKDEILYNL
ncbi:MAG: hypothetical protein ACRC4W_09055 [Treponemataceae bacterium]